MKKRLLYTLLFCILALNVIPSTKSMASELVQPPAAISSGEWAYIPNYPSTGEATIKQYNGKNTDVKVPATIEGLTVTVVDYDIIATNTSLTSITYPSSVKKIPHIYDNGDNLKSLNVDPANTVYSSIDGVLFDKEKKTLLCYPIAKEGTSYVVPSTVTKISQYAFYHCTNLSSIKVLSSVTSIGERAFEGCKNLKTVILSSGLKTIGKQAFWYCEQLEKINIPNTVKSIQSYAFAYCYKLKSIKLPNSVTSIGESTFNACKGLTSITIPGSVKILKFNTFMGCTSLTSVKLTKGLTTIQGNAFKGCTNLTSITIPDSVTAIGHYVFEGCKKLTSITIPKSVASIGRGLFRGCSQLRKIDVSAKNKKFASKDGVLFNKKITVLYVYPSAKKDTSYKVPSSVKTIATSAFYGCNNLKTLTVSKKVSVVENGTFTACKKLQTIYFLSGVKKIRDEFVNCKNLKTLVIPASVKSILISSKGDGILSSKAVTIVAPAKSYAVSFAKKNKIPFKIKK